MAKKKAIEGRVLIEVELGEVPENAYRPEHCDVSRLSPLQGDVLKRVTQALQAGGIQLKGGRFVTSHADSIRYLLERIGVEAGMNGG